MSQQVATQTHFADISNLEQWLSKLNERPETTKKQADYRAIPDSSDYDTIPIGVLENMLDEIYLGMWRTSTPTYQVVANEIIGTIILEVFHPVAKQWISRVGAGAVTIRQKKDSDITDIGAKIKTALQMDFPKLYSMCLKNAAKTLGKKFGRDLNRKFEDLYEPIYTNEVELNNVLDELTAKLQACATKQDLVNVWNQYPQFANNSAAKKVFNSRKSQLTYA